MPYSTVADHVPDLNLITWYAENGSSFLSRTSPWTKVAVLFLLVVFITLVRSVPLLILLFAAVLGLYAFAGLPLRKLLHWYLLPLFFVLSLIGILVWGEPGVPLVSLGGLVFTDSALRLVLTLTFKTLISVTYTLTFLMTTRYNYLSAMAYRLFPHPFDQIFMMSYRFLFLTLQTVDSLLKSVGARGGGLIRSVRRQGSIFADVFALVFIRSFDHADRVAKAMAARGYSRTYAALTPVPGIRPAEWIFLVAVGTGVVITAITGAGAGWNLV
jgi:cobalt/nickel transport system permease protein